MKKVGGEHIAIWPYSPQGHLASNHGWVSARIPVPISQWVMLFAWSFWSHTIVWICCWILLVWPDQENGIDCENSWPCLWQHHVSWRSKLHRTQEVWSAEYCMYFPESNEPSWDKQLTVFNFTRGAAGKWQNGDGDAAGGCREECMLMNGFISQGGEVAGTHWCWAYFLTYFALKNQRNTYPKDCQVVQSVHTRFGE